MNRSCKMNLRPTRPATKRFSSLRGLRWLAITGVFLLLAPRAVASAEITEGTGDMVGVTYLCLDLQRCSNGPGDCGETAVENFAAPIGNPQVPPSASISLPECSGTNSQGVEISSGPVNVAGKLTGDEQAVTLTFSGSGNLDGSDNREANMRALAHCNIEFVVLDEPTDLAISVAMTATGGALGNAVLTKGVETLGIITVDSTGQHGSFPPGPFDPGDYIVNTYAETAETGDFSASVTVNAAPCGVSRHTGPDGQDVVTVNQCGPIQWNNPTGGSFATKENWDPQTVPGLNNTAVFALDATYSVDVGTATSNAVEVSDGEVTFTNAHYDVVTLSVGGANEATLSVADSGSLFSSQSLIGLGGTGTVNLSGLNTFWDSGTLVVGPSGTGKLNLTDGASVTSSLGTVGSGPGLVGVVHIEGAGARWTLSDELIIHEGPVNVLDGGVLDAQLSIDVGMEPTAAAQLAMLEGGLVQTPNCTVWDGFLEVSGQGTTSSRLDVTDLLLIDPPSTSTSSAEVEISDGGTLVAQRVALGDGDGISSATLTISGVGSNGQASLLNVAGARPEFCVSGAPGTLLEVKDGGMLSTSSKTSDIGSGLFIGKVLIHGKSGSLPSIWAVSDDFLNIGSQVTPSELVVQEGGVVTGPDVFIFLGNRARELGRMTISGEDSSLNAGEIVVGEGGDGVLTVSGGAHCDVALGRVGAATSGDPTRGTGLATIQGTLLASSEWHVATITVGDNEPGTLRLEGETIGPFDVGGATLRADDTVTIGPKGFVRGNGTIVSPKVVGTNISPDVDIKPPASGSAVLAAAPAGKSSLPSASAAGGIIKIDGDYEQPADGKLTIDIVGVADGEFDVLHVTGNATLGGTLEMLFPGAYLPKAGDSFSFLKVDGTISGDFAEITFPQLLPGFLFDTVQVSGGLLFTAINDAVLAPTFLLNISTRLQVGTDENVLIGGFILQGTEAKRVLIRAIGPSLEAFGLSGALVDPTLELHDSTGALICQNDDWRETLLGGVITEDQFFEIFETGIPPTRLEESAIVATLDPGAYTAILAGANSSTGIGLVEVYDLGPAAVPAKLANISTRGFIQTGDNVMIGGFIIGNQTSEVLVRGIGPSLTAFGVSGALGDPTLELHDSNGALLGSNDNWRSDQEAEIEATTIPPNDDLESAILRTLAPGAYTAILRGVGDASGVGLVEAYNLD